MDHKRAEIRDTLAAQPLAELKHRAKDAQPPRNFFAALAAHPTKPAPDNTPQALRVIAEIKRKSPSAGWIRDEYQPGPGGLFSDDDTFDPAIIAKRYEDAGAAAISCLTDERFFAGSLHYINRIKAATSLPVLRKDFILDERQIYQARAAGADALLLIGECLDLSELIDLLILSHELRMTVLLEFHDPENYFRISPHLDFPDNAHTLLGINNRDLATMTTDLNHSLRMSTLIPDTSRLVAESGIASKDDIDRLQNAGINIILVGESLMRAPDPGNALTKLLTPET